MRKKTKEEWVEQANVVHNNKYDYSKVNYINGTTPVYIICPIHGEFPQVACEHLRGHGCPTCGRDVQRNNQHEWVERCQKIHNNKYDYSKVNYINNKTPVSIICPIHGEFPQKPIHHLHGHGCKECKYENDVLKKSKTNQIFLFECKKTHGEKYDYSKVNYINCKTPVCIICPKHGEFKQIPNDHIRGVGCPNCISSKLENNVVNLLTFSAVNFKRKYRGFDWLFNENSNRKLELDFYLPDHNIAIECQGEQHFQYKKWFGNKDELENKKLFEELQKRDIIKKRLCEEHNLPLYYINYNDNVEEKLNHILSLLISNSTDGL